MVVPELVLAVPFGLPEDVGRLLLLGRPPDLRGSSFEEDCDEECCRRWRKQTRKSQIVDPIQ
jgi:hypothetical protein